MSKPTAKELVTQHIISALVSPGYYDRADRYGHFKSVSGRSRIKMQAISWRFERKTAAGWTRSQGQFYSATTYENIAALTNLAC